MNNPISDELAIVVDQASKAYRIWKTPSARVTGPAIGQLGRLFPAGSAPHRQLAARAQRAYRDFWALRDVSFELPRGQGLGIIGRNGSGKSTLLQIIAGTLQPTSGSVQVRGRVAALLELGSGFNPDFTGRENVYLNATVLGLTRSEIDARFDDIASFAEIGDFIEQPVKTYSSGMVVRLAFAVAAHVNPDILIVDEALSVGDARFQLKCARAIDRFLDQGVTLLFVSHDTSAVKRLCRQALLLEGGRLLYRGRPNDVTNLYSKLIADGGSAAAIQADINALATAPDLSEVTDPAASSAAPVIKPAVTSPATPTVSADHVRTQLRQKAYDVLVQALPADLTLAQRAEAMLQDERSHARVTGQEFSYGGELGLIHEIGVHDTDDHPRTWFTTGERVEVRLLVEAKERFEEPIFALTVKNAAGVEVYGTNTLFAKQPARPIRAGEKRVIAFTFDIDLMPGHYFLSCGFTHFFGEELAVVHRRYDAVKIDVHGRDLTFGIANLHARIEEREVPDAPHPSPAP